MTTITILPDQPGSPTTSFRAVAGKIQSVGQTAGQALDALTCQLNGEKASTLIVIQIMRPDAWFSAAEQTRLTDLMDRWRAARNGQGSLSPEEQAELDRLVAAEYQAAVQRSSQLLRDLQP